MPQIKAFFISRKKLIVYIISIIVLLSLLIYIQRALASTGFFKGIFIENINMEGLNKQQAVDILKNRVNSKVMNEKLTLKYGEFNWSIPLQDIGFQYNIENTVDTAYKIGRNENPFKRLWAILSLRVHKVEIKLQPAFNSEKIEYYLNSIKNQIDRESKNVEILYKNGTIGFNKELYGRFINIDNNRKIIENNIKERNFNNIQLTVKEEKPEITYDEVKEISQSLSLFSTVFNAKDTNRTHNIRLASERINGVILMPGDIFSMNRALGERTLENGYKDAPVIYKNELVPGPGGGVCQVTTTLYGAVLKAKQAVIERTHHSLPLGYVELGQDATIAENYIDFKFQNDKDYPVAINAEVINNILNIRILGKKPENDNIIKLKSQIIEQYLPEGEEVIIDNIVPDGEKVVVREAKKGFHVLVFRETYSKSGQLVEKEKISDDIYRPVKAQVKVNQNYKNASINVSS